MTQRKARRIVVLTTLMVIVVCWAGSAAVGQTSFRFPTSEAKPESDMVRFLGQRFRNLTIPLDLSASVGLIAIPTKDVISLADLQSKKKARVGAVYALAGSVRLGLAPGAFTVDIVQENNRWTASLRDESEKEQAKVPANVILGPPETRTLATVEGSICYRINGGIVCI